MQKKELIQTYSIIVVTFQFAMMTIIIIRQNTSNMFSQKSKGDRRKRAKEAEEKEDRKNNNKE